MGHQSCCVKQKLRKGLWSPEEDEKLYNHITRFGVGSWSSVPKLAGLQRCGKSCRLRWINYLRPDLKRGMFSQEEEDLILSLHESLGNRWAQIATRLPGRTDNEIKNYWNSCLKKKLMSKGIDPNTHKPIQAPKDDHKDGVQSVNCPAASERMAQQPYNHLDSAIFTDARDTFVSKQTYDSLFLSELQDPCQQSLLRPYAQIGGDHIPQGLNPIPNLKSFVQENEEETDYAGSRMSAYVINNEMKESSSQCAFSWDPKNKMEPMPQFQVYGIQKKPSLWEEGNHQQLMNLTPGDFGNFPLPSLSQEMTEGNLQDFQHCNKL